MRNKEFTAPQFKADMFNCPFCRELSNHEWILPLSAGKKTNLGQSDDFALTICEKCAGQSIWLLKKMVFPTCGGTPYPSSDLPEDVAHDFSEARNISTLSPRGAAALLRLALQKLCMHLGERGQNINDDIANLVKKGLPVRIQQALDIVRVVGNESVHPGVIDRSDDQDTVMKLFDLINIVADVMITQPNQIEQLYTEIVPESKRRAIEERDSN
ncbi:MAG: DUF4145 domain-containing protein [Candidatus Aegiribacteria sp.]|nr:DUF4145 domain-containing protein [Candidatus Aegiribacteria sp.]